MEALLLPQQRPSGQNSLSDTPNPSGVVSGNQPACLGISLRVVRHDVNYNGGSARGRGDTREG